MPESRSAISPVLDRIVTASAHLPITPAEAFSYFVEDNRLQLWLAPEADVEPVVGGKYELFWEPADRENNSTIGCRITALEPEEYLAFQWRGPRQFKSFVNVADPLTHVVVVFMPASAGTRVHLVHSGWRSDPEWEEARRWQERAWWGAFKELERLALQ